MHRNKHIHQFDGFLGEHQLLGRVSKQRLFIPDLLLLGKMLTSDAI